MADGIRKCNDQVHDIRQEFYHGPNDDAAVFYGLYEKLADAFVEYRRVGKMAVYVDLGYWGRTEGGKLKGYHKVSINSRHPTAYFQKRKHPDDRFKRFGLDIKPWTKSGGHILVAGMGAKAATVEGFKPNQWEQLAINELRKHTDRPIVYRAKNSWRSAEPIDGTIFSWREPLEEVLENCWATVSHHSNVCIDGMLEGIPAFCYHGVASVMGLQDLSKIETPVYPDDRYQFMCDVAYNQWTPIEMHSGACWRHLKSEGLVP
jgi:hypothetical protein